MGQYRVAIRAKAKRRREARKRLVLLLASFLARRRPWRRRPLLLWRLDPTKTFYTDDGVRHVTIHVTAVEPLEFYITSSVQI